MNIINPFEYHKLSREDGGPDGRKYLTPDGVKLSSVTSILDSTGDKSFLHAWRKRIGDKEADRISQESASLGTAVHTHLENYITGRPRPTGTNLGRVMAKNMSDVIIEKGLCHVGDIWGVEAALYHSELWAGTTDLVGEYKGQPSIIDFKNTKKPKNIEWVQDYRCQLAAYSMAHNWLYDTDISQIVVLMVSRDCTFQEFIWRADDYVESEHMWSCRVAKYYGLDL